MAEKMVVVGLFVRDCIKGGGVRTPRRLAMRRETRRKPGLPVLILHAEPSL